MRRAWRSLALLAYLLCGGVSANNVNEQESQRVLCYVLLESDTTYIRCPEADHGFLKHRAWVHKSFFRGEKIPEDLKPSDALSCGVAANFDLTDCVVVQLPL